MHALITKAIQKKILFHQVQEKKDQGIKETAEQLRDELFGQALQESEKPGELSKEEFDDLLNSEISGDMYMIDYFKNNFEEIDKNGDGKLDSEELLECCVKIIQKQYEE